MVNLYGITSIIDGKVIRYYVNKLEEVADSEHVIIISSEHYKYGAISGLFGIERFINLEELYVCEGLFKTETLSGLIKLKKLYIDNNQLGTLYGLETLIELEELDVSDNNLKSIENIKHLVKLEKLCIGDNKISDISCLTDMVNMKILNCGCNRISSLNGIQNMKKLEVLRVGKNNIISFDEVSNCPNLKLFTHD
jgi:Leucine-rich repeat (LRR) protein